MDSGQPQTIALLSPCGLGNLGDAAIIDSVIAQIRKRHARARIVGITLNPRDTLARHGIRAVTLRGNSSSGYGIPEADRFPEMFEGVFHRVGDSKPASEPKANSAMQASEERLLRRAGLLNRLTRPLRRLFYPIKQELLHILLANKMLQQVDLVLVAGGGQLDDYWGGSWGHPYVLFKWSWLARLNGKKFAIMGVGTGTLKNPLSRFFIRRALGNASFRSFRDSGSRELVGAPGLTKNDLVGPDLAFGFEVDRFLVPESGAAAGLHVLLSPMSYLDPRIWPDKSATDYKRYVETLAQFAVDLVDLNYRVSLFAIDAADERTIADLMTIIRQSPNALSVERIQRPPIKNVSDVLALIAESHIVVASRLHGAILSCLMEKPTLALSYDRKVTVLMQERGLDEYCYNIALIDRQGLLQRIRQLADNMNNVVKAIASQNEVARQQVAAQFDAVMNCQL